MEQLKLKSKQDENDLRRKPIQRWARETSNPQSRGCLRWQGPQTPCDNFSFSLHLDSHQQNVAVNLTRSKIPVSWPSINGATHKEIFKASFACFIPSLSRSQPTPLQPSLSHEVLFCSYPRPCFNRHNCVCCSSGNQRRPFGSRNASHATRQAKWNTCLRR